MLPVLAALVLLQQDSSATYHASDSAPLVDPLRPVTRIGKDSFSVQYWTTDPCESRIELREGRLPMVAFGHKPDGVKRIVAGPVGQRQWHVFTVSGLKPGQRYYYRIWDPGAKPTAREADWGAKDGWRREYAVSTESKKGFKSIIHLPVKVLLMPNVVNLESAFDDPDNPAELPEKMSAADLQKIRDEYAVSSRMLWVNSGMRLWVDYQIFVDDRLERWGPEPKGAKGVYKDLPVCRSYAGVDYQGPGGGTWTIVDTKNVGRVTNDPVVEALPYSGQIEQAFPRKWNPVAKKWEFYNSGGGTYGVDEFPRGVPGRSQFLGGGDTAWLATHEFHHDLESHGEFGLSNREDDRIVFNHPAPRKRVTKGDGSVDEQAWSTSGRHGEHWDVMAYWDRRVSDAQWLRSYFGETLSVKDSDEDGFPDDDSRLPLDEKRFGSSVSNRATDGVMGDLEKVMLSRWVPGPLQSSWTKPEYQGVVPSPKVPARDGVFAGSPVIVPLQVRVDGNPFEWKNVPVAGSFDKGGIHFVFKQAHDESAYYGLYEIKGPWDRVSGAFDGEGEGVYSGKGVLGFDAVRTDFEPGSAGPIGPLVSVKPAFGGAPGLKVKASKVGESTFVEFSFPNRGDGPWYWTRGGHEIGVELNVWDQQGRGYSVWEAYHVQYARMLEPNGRYLLPADGPAELSEGAGGIVYRVGDPKVKLEKGWTASGGVWKHEGDESALFLDGLMAKEFDLLAVIEAKSDATLGGFTKPIKKMGAGVGYVGFVGGFGNSASRLRIYGEDHGDEAVGMPAGVHRVQLSRREGAVWLLLDGKVVGYQVDPNPRAVLDRLAVLGGYGGDQVVREIRVRL